MNEAIKTKMDDEILNRLDGLALLPAGSDDAKAQAETIATLYRARSEEEDKAETRSKSKKDHVGDMIMRGAELLVPLIGYGLFVAWGFDFEEHGVVTSSIFRDIIRKLPRK